MNVGPRPRVLVLHSGPEGDAGECAFCVAGRLHHERYPVLVADLTKYLASHILRERALLMCLETGRTPPPEELLDFIDFLGSLESGALRGLQYSVLCVERSLRGGWHEFGRQIDALLATLGAQRLAGRMDCPADFHGRLHVWTETVATMLALRQEPGAVV